MKSWYIVSSKPDDYGATRSELVNVDSRVAREYYNATPVESEDVETLKKYIFWLSSEEEAERSDSDRYYGTD